MVARALLFILGLIIFQSPGTKVILFYGDSLTAGYGLPVKDAFPAKVEEGLKQKGKNIKVINAGVSGETSAGGLSRIDWILQKPIDVFVLELGANDGLRGLPVESTRKNLQAIVDKVKAKYPKAKIVVAGMMVPPNMGAAYTTSFKKIFPELATKNNAVLIPFLLQDVAGNEKLNQSDRIHPNAEGHKIVARNVIQVLDKIL